MLSVHLLSSEHPSGTCLAVSLIPAVTGYNMSMMMTTCFSWSDIINAIFDHTELCLPILTHVYDLCCDAFLYGTGTVVENNYIHYICNGDITKLRFIRHLATIKYNKYL